MIVVGSSDGTPVEAITAVLSEKATQVLQFLISKMEVTGEDEIVLHGCPQSALYELADTRIRVAKRGRHGYTGIYSLISGYDVCRREISVEDEAATAVIYLNFQYKDGRIYPFWLKIRDGGVK